MTEKVVKIALKIEIITQLRTKLYYK